MSYILPPIYFNSPGQQQQTDYNAADTQAARESADYAAEANRMTADRTNSLAARLANARRTPGGGIRQGMRKKGFSASNATSGLTAANAAERLTRRKNELRAAADKQTADKNSAMASQGGGYNSMLPTFTIYR